MWEGWKEHSLHPHWIHGGHDCHDDGDDAGEDDDGADNDDDDVMMMMMWCRRYTNQVRWED